MSFEGISRVNGETMEDAPIGIVEALDTKHLVELLAKPETVEIEGKHAVDEKIELLFNLSKETGKSVFAVEAANGKWAIVAGSRGEVEEAKADIKAIDDLQNKIDARTLKGSCSPINELAIEEGVSHGCLQATKTSTGESVYPIRGVHVVGYRDKEKTRLVFDLTSKAYVFDNNKSDSDLGCQGVMFIQDTEDNSAIDAIYSTKWRDIGKPTISYAATDKKRWFKNH